MRVIARFAIVAAEMIRGEAFDMNIDAGYRPGPMWRLCWRSLLPSWANSVAFALAAVAAVALALGIAAPAAAQTPVDLQLALMVDASGSVNQYRFQLQKRGYVEALRNPKILAAIIGG